MFDDAAEDGREPSWGREDANDGVGEPPLVASELDTGTGDADTDGGVVVVGELALLE